MDYHMKWKLKAYTIFYTFKNLVENLLNCKIKVSESDGRKEVDRSIMHDLFFKLGVDFRKSC